MQNNRGGEPSDSKTKGKSKKQSKPHFMQVASYVCGSLVVILGIAAAIFFSVDQRAAGLWTSCAAMILVIIGGCCWYQDILWQKDEKEATSESSERARLSVEGLRLIFSEDGKMFTYQFAIHNYGKRPATIYAISFTHMSYADEDKLLDKPFYYAPDPRSNVVYPGQIQKVADDKWFVRLDAEVICCWGFVKYLSEGSTIEHVVGYGYRWRSGKEIRMITKPGYNYDR